MASPSIPQFKNVVAQILKNSWFLKKVYHGNMDFQWRLENGKLSFTEIPEEPFQSLLLWVRRLTMNNSPENLRLIQKKLKNIATHERDRHLLDVWKKYWRLSVIKEPFTVRTHDGKEHIITPFKAYDLMVNGHYFHSDESASILLYDSFKEHQVGDVNPFIGHRHHMCTCQIALAACSLYRYIEHGYTFDGIPLMGAGAPTWAVMHFVFFRDDRVRQLDDNFQRFREWIEENGGCENGSWF